MLEQWKKNRLTKQLKHHCFTCASFQMQFHYNEKYKKTVPTNRGCVEPRQIKQLIEGECPYWQPELDSKKRNMSVVNYGDIIQYRG